MQKGMADRESLKFQMPQSLIFFRGVIPSIACFIFLALGTSIWFQALLSSLCHWANQWLLAFLIWKSVMWLLHISLLYRAQGTAICGLEVAAIWTPGPQRFAWDGPPEVPTLSVFTSSECIWLPATLSITVLSELYKLCWNWFKFHAENSFASNHSHFHVKKKIHWYIVFMPQPPADTQTLSSRPKGRLFQLRICPQQL